VVEKPKLLVLELWGLGDLVIATPFLRAAAEKYSVSLLANPFAVEIQPCFWPQIKVIPFIAPWTVFHGKYQLWRWPWPKIIQLRRQIVAEQFTYGLSARWDPRDHLVLKLSGARERLGFTRLKSQRFLTRELERPNPTAHRREYWRVAGEAIGLNLSEPETIDAISEKSANTVLLHSGARLPVRVWPLENFQTLATRLREKNITVQIACDPNQIGWWQSRGEQPLCPRSVTELIMVVERAGIFIGNDSGPGHLAAFYDVPTFTIFGPQLSEWFAPVNPAAEVFEGKACPYKPCSDYCRYDRPFCLADVNTDEVWARVEKFAAKHLS
jgi:ADP-heptose:LPS heptosyltransferase